MYHKVINSGKDQKGQRFRCGEPLSLNIQVSERSRSISRCAQRLKMAIYNGRPVKIQCKGLHTTRSVRKRKKLYGVLIICETCVYTQSDFEGLTQTTKSIVWNGNPKEWTGFEILIINLSIPALRKDFFGLAQGVVDGGSRSSSTDVDRIVDIIEKIIYYEQKTDTVIVLYCVSLQYELNIISLTSKIRS